MQVLQLVPLWWGQLVGNGIWAACYSQQWQHQTKRVCMSSVAADPWQLHDPSSCCDLGRPVPDCLASLVHCSFCLHSVRLSQHVAQAGAG